MFLTGPRLAEQKSWDLTTASIEDLMNMNVSSVSTTVLLFSSVVRTPNLCGDSDPSG
jgi:hypothetical protein